MIKNNSSLFPRSDMEILLAKIHESCPDHALHAIIDRMSLPDHKIRTYEDFLMTELAETLEDLLFNRENGLAIAGAVAEFELTLTKKNGGTRRLLRILRMLANPENMEALLNDDPIHEHI
jgi:hypothetical protein